MLFMHTLSGNKTFDLCGWTLETTPEWFDSQFFYSSCPYCFTFSKGIFQVLSCLEIFDVFFCLGCIRLNIFGINATQISQRRGSSRWLQFQVPLFNELLWWAWCKHRKCWLLLDLVWRQKLKTSWINQKTVALKEWKMHNSVRMDKNSGHKELSFNGEPWGFFEFWFIN